MKVILLKDVSKLGQTGAVKEVADGYAQNMLIPNGLAEMATDKKIEAIENKKEEVQAQNEAKEKEIIASLKALDGKKIVMQLPVNEKGHLYKQVNADDIQTAIKNETRQNIPVSAILLEQSLKEAGEHTISLKSAKVTSRIILNIQRGN